MTTVRYSEIREGDVGAFTDGTIWIATSEFKADYDDWGTFTILVPFEKNYDNKLEKPKDIQLYMDGKKDTTTTLIHRMS